jgi:hypothetical protein
MARELKNKTNVNSPNSEYPYGQIRDDDGTRTYGTPVNEELYGDIQQFFSKMFEYVKGHYPTFDYNDNPENAYDGFQFHEALLKTRPYKVYTAFLNQSSTSAPIETVMPDQNTIGAIAWTRVSQGVYRATLTGAFPDGNKTFRLISGLATGGSATLNYLDQDRLTVSTYDNAGAVQDGLLVNTCIEIRVYP